MSENITEVENATQSGSFDIDYNLIQDRLLNATLTPINFVWEVQLYYKITFILGILVVTGLIYPLLVQFVKSIRAVCNPIMFSYKHVLITGCGTGLGKALV